MVYFEVPSNSRVELLDITRQVDDIVARTGIESGICFVYIPHTTAGVIVNENHDPDVSRDILHALSSLVPSTGDYRHKEGNADAHVKATLVGNSVQLPVRDGHLALGTWQGVLLCEFDGPRRRRAGVSVVAGSVPRQ